MKVFCILVLTCTIISNNFIESTEITWGYNEEVEIIDDFKILSPDTWYKKYPDCRGAHQSPINIVKSETDFDKSLTAIRFNSKVLDYGSNSVWIRKILVIPFSILCQMRQFTQFLIGKNSHYFKCIFIGVILSTKLMVHFIKLNYTWFINQSLILPSKQF